MSRASSMSNVMRQVFGAFGTAIVVTILQLRQTYHTAILSQTVTPENIPLQQLMSMAQQMGVSQGLSAVQAQAMGMMLAAKQVALTAAVMGFDDVFRVTAVITLLAIPAALFMKTQKLPASGGQGPTIAH
jgi:DHA2 family multidrug resistance protein